jgi:hypothetical protein
MATGYTVTDKILTARARAELITDHGMISDRNGSENARARVRTHRVRGRR